MSPLNKMKVMDVLKIFNTVLHLISSKRDSFPYTLFVLLQTGIHIKEYYTEHMIQYAEGIDSR